jgi:hypothetical protein
MAGNIKYKQVSGGAGGGDYIQCRPTKQHVIDYATAQRLHQGGIVGLLPFSFADEGTRAEFFYFTDGLLVLRQAMDAGLSFSQVYTLLKGIISTLETCVSLGMPTQNIDFDPSRVLIRPVDLQPMFIYVPLQNYQPDAYDVRSLLLLVVSQSRPANEAEQAQIANLLNHLKQQSLFSLIDLKDFLGLGGKRGLPISGRLTTGSRIAKPLRRVRDFVSENSGVGGSRGVPGTMGAPGSGSGSGNDAGMGAGFGAGVNRGASASASAGGGVGGDAAPGSGSYALVRVSDNATWRINNASLVLGRVGGGQALKVSDSSTVGRAHAHLFLHNGRCYVADNNSKNGTFVNGRQLGAQQPVEVGDGSTVVLGAERFVIRVF